MGAVFDRLNLTLAEVKNYLKVEVSDDDTLIQSLIDSAKVAADDYLNNSFENVYRERVGRADGSETVFTVDNTPVFIDSETVYLANEEQVLDSDYTFDYTDGEVTFLTVPESGLVEISYEAELAIPEPIKTWCLQRIARQYERRSEGLESESVSGIGSTAWGDNDYSLLNPYRRLPGL